MQKSYLKITKSLVMLTQGLNVKYDGLYSLCPQSDTNPGLLLTKNCANQSSQLGMEGYLAIFNQDSGVLK